MLSRAGLIFVWVLSIFICNRASMSPPRLGGGNVGGCPSIAFSVEVWWEVRVLASIIIGIFEGVFNGVVRVLRVGVFLASLAGSPVLTVSPCMDVASTVVPFTLGFGCICNLCTGTGFGFFFLLAWVGCGYYSLHRLNCGGKKLTFCLLELFLGCLNANLEFHNIIMSSLLFFLCNKL